VFDYNKALMFQVWNATWTFEEYVEYINEPKHLVNPTRDVKLFDFAPFEFATQSPWWGIPLFYIPLIMYYLMTARYNDFSLQYKIGIILAGAVSWSWLEYTLHRFVFHGEDYWMCRLPHHQAIWSFHFLIHGIHHAFPQDRYRLVFPPIPGVLVLYVFGYTPFSFIVPSNLMRLFYAGFLMGYMAYDIIHYFMHHSNPAEGSYWKVMKLYHMQHHYKWGMIGFGVSSQFWDYVYDTAIEKKNTTQ